MQILELASNITLRLFMRPFEAVLSFKSLFEGVLDHRLSSYFTWLALFTPRFSWAYFWGQNGEKNEVTGGQWRPLEAIWGHLRLRSSYGCQNLYFFMQILEMASNIFWIKKCLASVNEPLAASAGLFWNAHFRTPIEQPTLVWLGWTNFI